MQTLEELLKETDALTYINSLKITLQELKNEFSKIEEMSEYITQGVDRSRRLIRKADNQYRLITKLVQKESITLATEVSISNTMDDDRGEDEEILFDEVKELMGDE